MRARLQPKQCSNSWVNTAFVCFAGACPRIGHKKDDKQIQSRVILKLWACELLLGAIDSSRATVKPKHYSAATLCSLLSIAEVNNSLSRLYSGYSFM
jgi:hypothetical protein